MPPKHLRSSVASNSSAGNNKIITQLQERVNLLEMRYSTVMLHQTYFKLLDEWLQCMFGAELFPKPKDIQKNEENEEEEINVIDNPFYEVHMLHQRIRIIEDELQSMGIDIPQFKIPKPQFGIGNNKPNTRKSYGTPVFQRRSFVETTVQPVRPPPPPPAKTGSASQSRKSSKDEKVVEPVAPKMEAKEETVVSEKEKEDSTTTSTASDEEKEKPPMLEEQIKMEPEDEEMEEIPAPEDSDLSRPTSAMEVKVDPDLVDEDMDMDDEEYEEKLDSDDIEYAIGKRAERRARESARRGGNNGTASGDVSESEQSVTYTTRGRRHTLPRRYAEFTGHDNVTSILKSQQRTSGSGSGSKSKRQAEKARPAPKPRPPPKLSTPKKPDGSRPECVYNLISQVQAKQADAEGDIVLWDDIPSVKVNQQQLISVIFRSNGMATRLTRKLTTLVFEDQVLANTSPFGTKYYQERLPPEPLEAMVEFISNSGFDADYTKKKIYMVVGQVCNEARAGRVRKLPIGPSGSGSAGSSVQETEDYEPPLEPEEPPPPPIS